MGTPFLDELVRRLRMTEPDARVRSSGARPATVTWREDPVDHPLALLVGERGLAAAATALGRDRRDPLWPDSTVDETGSDLLLIHVDEVVTTRDTTAPLRVTPAGPQWPEDR